jgi:hypothetical protein
MVKSMKEKEMTGIESVAADIQGYENVIAICMDKEGAITVHATMSYPPDLLWAIEQARNQLFDLGGGYDS